MAAPVPRTTFAMEARMGFGANLQHDLFVASRQVAMADNVSLRTLPPPPETVIQRMVLDLFWAITCLLPDIRWPWSTVVPWVRTCAHILCDCCFREVRAVSTAQSPSMDARIGLSCLAVG